MLCRDMLSEICHGQPTAPERATRVRAAVEFKDLKVNLRQGFVATGVGDLQKGLLTVDAAKKRKAEQHIYQAEKQQKLLQAERPKAIQCAA